MCLIFGLRARVYQYSWVCLSVWVLPYDVLNIHGAQKNINKMSESAGETTRKNLSYSLTNNMYCMCVCVCVCV